MEKYPKNLYVLLHFPIHREYLLTSLRISVTLRQLSTVMIEKKKKKSKESTICKEHIMFEKKNSSRVETRLKHAVCLATRTRAPRCPRTLRFGEGLERVITILFLSGQGFDIRNKHLRKCNYSWRRYDVSTIGHACCRFPESNFPFTNCTKCFLFHQVAPPHRGSRTRRVGNDTGSATFEAQCETKDTCFGCKSTWTRLDRLALWLHSLVLERNSNSLNESRVSNSWRLD